MKSKRLKCSIPVMCSVLVLGILLLLTAFGGSRSATTLHAIGQASMTWSIYRIIAPLATTTATPTPTATATPTATSTATPTAGATAVASPTPATTTSGSSNTLLLVILAVLVLLIVLSLLVYLRQRSSLRQPPRGPE